MKIIRSQEIPLLPASHEDPLNPGVLKKVLITKADAPEGNLQMVNWALLPKNSAFSAHYHEDMQEIFIMLNGPVVITVNEHEETLYPGDTVSIPPHCIHSMKNTADEDVTYIVVGISSGSGGRTVVVENGRVTSDPKPSP